jgi:hypothetical protein
MDARLETELDTDLAAAFGFTDLFFPARARFIAYSQIRVINSICLAYGNVNVHTPYLTI